jgi:hypothetical protein
MVACFADHTPLLVLVYGCPGCYHWPRLHPEKQRKKEREDERLSHDWIILIMPH